MKILICGIVASGKTTLAERLSEKHGIPHFESDCIAWGFPDEQRFKRTDDEQKNRITELDKNTSWIIEGVFRESQRSAFDLADRIVFLNTPLYKRIFRILTRFMKQKLGVEKSNYKPTFQMLGLMFKWTRAFEKNRKSFEEMLLRYENKLIWVKAEKELDDEKRLVF